MAVYWDILASGVGTLLLRGSGRGFNGLCINCKNTDMEEMLKLKCECGKDFERPLKYKIWHEKNYNVAFKWKLQYCDDCFHKRVKDALKRLPEVINAIIKDKD